jgi:hypothetical protein
VNAARVHLDSGAISSFYRPAFTQVCVGNGEWLINGFKVDKTGVSRLVGTFGIDKKYVNLAEAATGKGSTQAESDIAKFAIINWGTKNATLIVTLGEDKVGAGEASGAKGKEIAQLRYTLFAIYYMWHDLHRPNAPNHPWRDIPVNNLILEAVFLGAGAAGVRTTAVSAQNVATRIQNPLKKTEIITAPVRAIDLNQFCAIFRLDRKRFAYAITNVNRKFLNGMSKYFQTIKENMNKPNALKPRFNLNKPNINLKVSLSTTNLTAAAKAAPFKPAILRKPREGMSANRKKAELNWLRRVKNVGGVNRKSVNNAIKTFQSGIRPEPGLSEGASRGEGFSNVAGKNVNMNNTGSRWLGVFNNKNRKTIEELVKIGNRSGVWASLQARTNISNANRNRLYHEIFRGVNQPSVRQANIRYKRELKSALNTGRNLVAVYQEIPANVRERLKQNMGQYKNTFNQLNAQLAALREPPSNNNMGMLYNER